ncbi:MAG: 4-hydroxy-tetrahydrodipicolinate reductase [Christensenellaceae bacterium]
MIKILISGANGRLGQTLSACIAPIEDMVVVAGVDKMPNVVANAFPVYDNIDSIIEHVDVIIDFSRPDALHGILEFAQKHSCAAVLCTTGYTSNDKVMIAKYAGHIPLFYSANMSLGVNLQIELAKKAAEFLGDKFDVEIIEKHHNLKVDSPSGTALSIAEHINSVFMNTKEFVYGRTPKSTKREPKEIGIHAVRGGTVVGEHDVLFLGNDEVIEISHKAQSKQVFAEGAIRAAQYIYSKPAGLYSMADIISESNIVTNIYTEENDAVITLSHLPHNPKLLATIFNSLAKSEINIDIISQSYPQNDFVDVAFSLHSKDIEKAKAVIEKIGSLDFSCNLGISKLTIEGIGMEKQSGVAAKLFSALVSDDIKIYIVTTANTKISFCIDSKNTTKAIKAVTQAFKL